MIRFEVILTFRQAVWLYSAGFCLHVLEEWPYFTNWARRFASPVFTQQQYRTPHLAGIAIALASAGILWMFRNRITVFVFFALILTPTTFRNALFHAVRDCGNRDLLPGSDHRAAAVSAAVLLPQPSGPP